MSSRKCALQTGAVDLGENVHLMGKVGVAKIRYQVALWEMQDPIMQHVTASHTRN